MMCRAEPGDVARSRPRTAVSTGDPGGRANPQRLDHGCHALGRRGHQSPGHDLIRDTPRVELDAAELSRLEVIAPSITLPPFATIIVAAKGWEAARGSRLRDGAASL